MTGGVKEELLTRWAELGLTVAQGSIRFSPMLLSDREFRTEPGSLSYLDVADRNSDLSVPSGCAAFTICRVPIVVHAAGTHPAMVVTLADGSRREVAGWSLDQLSSRQIFDHAGVVVRLDVFIPGDSIRR